MEREKSSNVKVVARNRRARHDYDILESYEAGLVLRGTEVKAVREGKVQLKDAYVELRDGEAYLQRAHIGPYQHAGRDNHDPERPRKLLLHRRQIDRLRGKIQGHGRGLTIVPLQVLTRGPWIKVEIALAQGKRLYDKRERERLKELDREMERARSRSRW